MTSSNEDEQLPNYMMPNFASILPEYSNSEADQIRHAFSVGNYQSLTKMPTKLGPNEVWKARQSQIDGNRMNKNPANAKIVTSCGLFSQFEYVPSRYSLAKEIENVERMEAEAKRLQIAGRDFVCGVEAKKYKHQDGFDASVLRSIQSSEPYDLSHDVATRAKWIADKKVLHGPFVTPANFSLDKPTRKLLPTILKEIQDVIEQDWEGYVFEVSLTDDDNIAIRFETISVDSERGLVAYMNVFARTHVLMSKYSLTKLTEDWNAKPGDGGLYFVLRPPWVKLQQAKVL